MRDNLIRIGKLSELPPFEEPAFGLLLALSLYSMKEETGFDVTYRSLLGRTGSEEVLPLLRSVGIDAEDAGFWMRGVDMIRSFKERMEGCV